MDRMGMEGIKGIKGAGGEWGLLSPYYYRIGFEGR